MATKRGSIFDQKVQSSGVGWSNKYCFLVSSDLKYPRDVKLIHVWQGFKEKTTAHGIPHVDQSRGFVKRAFWILISLLMLAGLTYNLTTISIQFFAHPVDVTSELLHQTELVFPAVTLCNMSPVRRSAMEAAVTSGGNTQDADLAQSRKKRSLGVCPTEWIYYNGVCYYISVTKVTWDVANTYCHNYNAELSSISDGDEQLFLENVSFDITGNDYWIGLYYVGNDWTWTDGQPVSYTNWDPAFNEPDGTGVCGKVSKMALWRDMRCDMGYRFICKSRDTYTTAPPTAAEEITLMEQTTSAPYISSSETQSSTTATQVTASSHTVTQLHTTDSKTGQTSMSKNSEPSQTTDVHSTETSKPETQSTTTYVGDTEITQTLVSADTKYTQHSTWTLTSGSDDPNTEIYASSSVEFDNVTEQGQRTVSDSFENSTKQMNTNKAAIQPESTYSIQSITETRDVQSTEMTQSTFTGDDLSSTPTRETTTSWLTTLPGQATSPASTTDTDPKLLEKTCCCTCCFTDQILGPDTCSTCSAENYQKASYCAAKTPTTSVPPSTTTTTITPQPTMTTKPPLEQKSVNGSKFPERVEVREDFKKEEGLTQMLADVPLEEKTKLGYSAADLILDCTYAGVQCYPSLFSTIYSPVHGNCYVFNSGWNSSIPLLHSKKVGRRYGLHLIVNIEQDDYVKEVGDTAGIRLVVHPQSRMPFPEDEGVTVSPGHSTSIGVRQVYISREAAPYGNCTDPSVVDYTRNVYEELYNVRYSSSGCEKTCYQRNMIEKCGCGDPYYPMYGLAFGYVTVTACDASNITQDDCRYEVSMMHNRGELPCDCPDSCQDTMYSLEVSIGQWPSNVQKADIFQMLSTKMGASVYQDDYKYEENLIKLEVFYEEFNFEVIDERPAYSPVQYVSDIGGILGLWIGFSLITIFEFFELGMDLVVWLGVLICMHPRVQAVAEDNIDIPAESVSGPGCQAITGHTQQEQDSCREFSAPFFLHEDMSSLSDTEPSVNLECVEMNNVTPPPPYTYSRPATARPLSHIPHQK